MNNRKTQQRRHGRVICTAAVGFTNATKAPERRGLCRTSRRLDYFSEFEMVTKLEDSWLPTPFTAAMVAIAMPAAIRPYSMAVAPDSSFTKRETRFFIDDNSCVHMAGRT